MAITISQAGTLTMGVDGLGRPTHHGGSLQLSGSGGTGPYHFSVLSGAMPDGLLLDGSGAIRTTPRARGSALVRIRCTDSAVPPNFVDSDITLVVS